MGFLAWRGPEGALSPMVGRLGGTIQITASHGAAVSYPAVEATTTTANESATSQSITLPSGIASGELLLVFFNGADATSYTLSTPSGWTELYNVTQGTWFRAKAIYRVADGSEGSTISITMSNAQRLSAVAMRVSGWDTSGGIGSALSAGGASGGTSNAPNPGSLTSGFGEVPTLWIAVSHSAAGGSISYPSTFTDNETSAYTGVFNNFHARTSVSTLSAIAASQDPGTFGITDSVNWRAATVAVKGT